MNNKKILHVEKKQNPQKKVLAAGIGSSAGGVPEKNEIPRKLVLSDIL